MDINRRNTYEHDHDCYHERQTNRNEPFSSHVYHLPSLFHFTFLFSLWNLKVNPKDRSRAGLTFNRGRWILLVFHLNFL